MEDSTYRENLLGLMIAALSNMEKRLPQGAYNKSPEGFN